MVVKLQCKRPGRVATGPSSCVVCYLSMCCMMDNVEALCRGKEKSSCTPSPPAESLPVIWLEGEACSMMMMMMIICHMVRMTITLLLFSDCGS
eukprot:4093652-Amphidinium_carterae.1